MLIGEFPSDCDSFGVHSFQRANHIKVASEHRLVRALQELALSPDLFYGTTALKCQGRRDRTRGTQMPPTFIEACRENHLGVEIEAMEPAVIWLTGLHSADSVCRHFKMEKRLGIGDVVLIDAPDIWRFSKILVLRSSHPKDRYRDNVMDMAQIVEVYLREFVYGQRTQAAHS